MKIIPTTSLTDLYFSDSHVKPKSIFLPYFMFDKKYKRISIEKNRFGSSNVGYKGASK